MEITIDKFGRVLIPKSIREHLGLEPGVILDIEEADHTVVLKAVVREGAIKKKAGMLVVTGKATGDLEQAAQKSRHERLRKIGLGHH